MTSHLVIKLNKTINIKARQVRAFPLYRRNIFNLDFLNKSIESKENMTILCWCHLLDII